MPISEPISEQQMREHFRTTGVTGTVDTAQILATGHRQLRARRRRRAVMATVPAVVIAVSVGLARPGPDQAGYELTGSGLTLAAGSDGPVQTGDDRVDLGGGLQAWREGKVLGVGYPGRPYAQLDTSLMSSNWGEMDYDVATLDSEGEDDGETAVVGTVHGKPARVEVTIAGVTRKATIACFTQARGWCSYAAVVPVDVEDYATQPTTVRIS